MHVYGCRVYVLNYYIQKNKKLGSQTHIGYLVEYDSTNIYRIWIPSRGKMIRSRDVTLNDNLLYNPSDLDIDILTVYASKHQDRIDKFESDLLNKYEIRKLEEAEHFLGIRIVRDRPQRRL